MENLHIENTFEEPDYAASNGNQDARNIPDADVNVPEVENEERYTCFGDLVEQFTNDNTTDKQKENAQISSLVDGISEIEFQNEADENDNALLKKKQKAVSRSYSIESGDVLNEKYGSDSHEGDWVIGLDCLPAELFLHICSFLDAKFVIKTLGQVSKSFHTIVNDATFWRVRMGKRWNNKYPAIPGKINTVI